jgi:hypothetical protein
VVRSTETGQTIENERNRHAVGLLQVICANLVLIRAHRTAWIDQLFDFGQYLSSLVKEAKELNLRVAVLGDGVDADRFPDRIVSGISYVRDRNSEYSYSPSKPYYISPSGHGNCMVDIILRACPLASIYVARVFDGTEQVILNEGIQAVTRVQNIHTR